MAWKFIPRRRNRSLLLKERLMMIVRVFIIGEEMMFLGFADIYPAVCRELESPNNSNTICGANAKGLLDW